MKYVLPFLTLLATVAVFNGFYLFGGIILLFVTFVLLRSVRSSHALFELYDNMPTVWQDIQETIEIGQRYFPLQTNNDPDLLSVFKFYGMLKELERLFEIKIDEGVVSAFETKYGIQLPFPNLSPMTRALFYFINSADTHQDRADEIKKAVFVRKKVSARRKKVVNVSERSFKPSFA